MKQENDVMTVRHEGARWFWWPLIVIFLMSAGWAAASPISSVPDEPAHIVKAAAVVRGQLVGVRSGESGPVHAVDVPRYIEHSRHLTCFINDVKKTPACSPLVEGDKAEIVTGLTSAGLYNPVYYAAVGWPTLLMDGFKAVYAMRLVSALLTSVFLALAFSALSRLPRSKWALLALSAAITPMTLFLNGSVNPNSLEYGTTTAIAANLWLLLNRAGQKLPLVPVVATTVAAMLLANTKALSLLWLLVVVVGVLVLASAQQITSLFRNIAVWVGAAAIAVSCAFGLWWVVRHDSLSSKPFEGAGLDFGTGAEIMVDRTFLYMQGYIGEFGWLELDAPTGVMALWTGIVFVTVLAGIIYGRGRKKAAAIFMASSLLVLPVLLQAAVISEQGLVWQGRYILAVFVPCLLIAGIALDDAGKRPWPAQSVAAFTTLIVLAALSHVITFVWVLRRYVTGLALEVRWADFLANPSWEPPLGTLPTVAVFGTGAVLGAILMVRYVRNQSALAQDQPAPLPESPAQGAFSQPLPRTALRSDDYPLKSGT